MKTLRTLAILFVAAGLAPAATPSADDLMTLQAQITALQEALDAEAQTRAAVDIATEVLNALNDQPLRWRVA